MLDIIFGMSVGAIFGIGVGAYNHQDIKPCLMHTFHLLSVWAQTSALMTRSCKLIRIAVIGAPGHGKSTFLNAMMSASVDGDELDEDQAFMTASSAESCTKKCSSKTIKMAGYKLMPPDDDGNIVDPCETGEIHDLELVDTMGFPDPDKAAAADFYDKVVTDAVNHEEGLNALVWVVKGDRVDADVFARFKVFMKQLGQAKCRFLVIVNGQANYESKMFKKKKPDEQEKIKREDFQNMLEYGQTLLATTGLSDVREVPVVPSGSIDNLEDKVPKALMAYLEHSTCVKSKLLTYQGLKDAHKDEETAIKTLKEEMESNAETRKREEEEMQKTMAALAAEVQRQKDLKAAAEKEAQMKEQEKQRVIEEKRKAEETQKAASSKIENARKSVGDATRGMEQASKAAEQAAVEKKAADAQNAEKRAQADKLEREKANAQRASEREQDAYNAKIMGHHANAAWNDLKGGAAGFFTFGYAGQGYKDEAARARAAAAAADRERAQAYSRSQDQVREAEAKRRAAEAQATIERQRAQEAANKLASLSTSAANYQKEKEACEKAIRDAENEARKMKENMSRFESEARAMQEAAEKARRAIENAERERVQKERDAQIAAEKKRAQEIAAKAAREKEESSLTWMQKTAQGFRNTVSELSQYLGL